MADIEEKTGSPADDVHGNNAVLSSDNEGFNSEPVCPAHTTERRLLSRVDLHVLPFLCIMYLLAFLGKLLP